MFYSVVFAPWPRGLYLAKKLSEQGLKVAYVELLPRQPAPFGLFIEDNSKVEKIFLESLGFLSQQEGGFCLLSSQGVWPLQDIKGMEARHPVLTNKRQGHFANQWLSYLSLNLASKVFEYNNSEFSNRSLNLFSNYFLFEPSFKKIEQFQKNHPNISFYQISSEDKLQKQQMQSLIQENGWQAEKQFFLGTTSCPWVKGKDVKEPYWQWQACFFEMDFGDYVDTIPLHFVSIKDIFLPWSHDNLLSVFHKNGQLEVWMRVPSTKEVRSFIKGAKEHLETFFPNGSCSFIDKTSLKSWKLYSQASLFIQESSLKQGAYIENLNDFFQGDLVSEIGAEQELFDSL